MTDVLSNTQNDRVQWGWLLVEWLPRLLVAALFIYTGVTKIADPATFLKEVRAYEVAPLVVTNLVTYVLPWVEVVAGLALVAGVWRPEARTLVALMLIVFVAAKAWVLGVEGRAIDCGCVPTDSFLHVLFDGWTGVVTNLVLLAFLVVEGGLARARLRRRAPRSERPEPETTKAAPA